MRALGPTRSGIAKSSLWLVAWLAALLACPACAWSEGEFKPLGPGVEYRHDVRPAGPLSIHALRLDRRQKWDFQTALGKGTVCGLESLPGIVRRLEAATKKPAAAAINGDFFLIKPGPYQGDPTGLQIAQGELVSGPGGRTSFWIAPGGEPKIGSVEAKFRVVWPDGKTTPIGINQTRPEDGAVLYTPALDLRAGEESRQPPTTRTKNGRELLLAPAENGTKLPIQAGKTYRLTVVEVREGGQSPLQADRVILSLGAKMAAPAAKPGDRVQVVMETSPSLEGVTTAIGGGRTLVTGGQSPDLGPARQPRHPRSMIGWNARHLFLIVIDGRRSFSIGMTYPEMAALAKEYGCSEAMELDGGGSSTLWAGKILNSPSDGRPRALANGLILFRQP